MSSRSQSYIRASIITRPNPPRDVEILSRNTGTVHLVSETDLDLIRFYDRPRTVSDHINHIGTQPDLVDRHRDLTETLHGLIDAGLLRPCDTETLTERAHSRTLVDSESEHPSPWISIPTSGRVDVLNRLINSLAIDDGSEKVQDASIVLDSYDNSLESELREMVATIQCEHSSLRCRVIGKTTRKSHIAALSKRLSFNRFERSAVSFGLLGNELFITTGATQTHALLACPHSQTISLDDDVVSKGFVGAVEAMPRMTPRGSLTVQYAHSRVTLESFYEFNHVDIPEVIQPYLGKSVSELIAAYPHMDLPPDEMTPEFWARLERSDPTVDAIVLGTLGDSGVGQTALLMSDGISVPQFQGDAHAQSLALTSRAICGIASAPTFTTQPFFMTAACAYNLTRILPPFFPFGRGQDGLFGLMYTQILDDTLIGQIPVAIQHDPLDGRSDRLDHPPDRIIMIVCRIVGMLASHYGASLYGGTREERIVGFGEWLLDLSHQKGNVFRARITDLVCESLHRYSERIRVSYQNHIGTGSPLGVTVGSLLTDIRDRVDNRRIGPIDDFRRLRLSDQQEFEYLSTAFSHFGLFLTIWPAIWEERAIFQEGHS